MELAVAGLVTLSVGLAVGLALAIAGLLRTRREAHRDLQALESQCERFEEAVARRTVELSDTHEELAAACAVRDRLEGELQRSRRMEAVGRLAGGTLHDFNNLLTTITVYAELLEAALPEKSPLREEVGQIQEANRQAARLAGQLGRRRQLGEETPGIDLGELLRESAPMLGHLLGPDVEIHLAVPKHPLPAAVDPDQLRQVMINLALNARDAMPTGGHFTVEAEALAESKLAREGAVRLSFSDTGTGMSPEIAQRIFDPYFTTKAGTAKGARGTGLGLSSVEGIVRHAGGDVRVVSEPGRGTRFELDWPRVALAPEAAPRAVLGPRGRSERILLVDDEDKLRHGLARVLRKQGYAVLEAENGAHALEIATKPGEEFDLVVSDVVMPRMSGLELAERLAISNPKTRVLMLSGHMSTLPSSRLGELPFLAKPFGAADLCAEVRALLDAPRG